MTLVEFVAPLAKKSKRDQCLGVMYYLRVHENKPSSKVAGIKDGLKRAKVKGAANMNVSDLLGKAGALAASVDGEWVLTETGTSHVEALLNIFSHQVELKNEVGSLASVAAAIADTDVAGYVEEAILCLKAGALRASIVFLWTGAVRIIQQKVMASGETAVNAALIKHDPKSRTVKKVEDFAFIKDATLLLATVDLGIYDKSQKAVLESALGLRNQSGHPTKYVLGVKKVASFIEDVVGLVFK